MDISIKINDPNNEMCLGLYNHKITVIKYDNDDDFENQENANIEYKQRTVIGFLIFSIDLIW